MKIFAFAFFAFFLAGCGGGSDNGEPPAPTEKRSDDLATRSKDRANDAVAALATSADQTRQAIEENTEDGSSNDDEGADATENDGETGDLSDTE